MKDKHESSALTYSSAKSLEARSELFNLMEEYPGTPEEKERSLGLFVRGSLMARFLAVFELYQQIVKLPGIILDLGTWRGQTAVLCENFRAILEPLHFNRRIVCFDTFKGYAGFSKKDKPTDLHKDGTYPLGGSAYADLLRQLLLLHEKNNAMGHVQGKHQVIEGDIRTTLPAFFKTSPHEVVSLAFFDLNSVEPTKQAFDLVYKRLAPGGLIAFWQLTRDVIPAEGIVYTQNILNDYPHTLFRTASYPGLCYLKK